MNEKKCKATGRILPNDLAGFQQVFSTAGHPRQRIAADDLLIYDGTIPTMEWPCPSTVGQPIRTDGTWVGYRVYRKLSVPRPGDTEKVPGKDITYAEERAAQPAIPHHSTIGCGPRTSLPTTAAERKGVPIATGCIDYFPDAIAAVARLSKVGNDQHNPGKPLHWDKSKSTDEADSLMRHFLDRGTLDTDGVRHSAKVAWRALALLQREIDAERVGGVK